VTEDEHRQVRHEVLGELRGIIAGLQAGGRHTLVLSDYEVVNLRAAIHATGYASAYGGPENPLSVLNSGDWIGQIFQRLPYLGEHMRPNATAEELVDRARARQASDAAPS
jgi:hypothetical protein